jgi:AcrR family transcriptional regulator
MPEADPVEFQRARTAEQKQRRRESILTAARELAVRSGVRTVTLTRIAEEVGIAPSNVLANFGTREDIYFHLLAEAWTDWTDELETALAGQPADPLAIATAITASLVAKPLFCDLAAYIAPHYEYNASPETIRRLSLVGHENAVRFVTLLGELLPITAEDAGQLMNATFSLTHYWWMRSHPSTELEAVRAQEPSIAAQFDFESELRRMLTTYLEGLLAQAQKRR